MKEKILLALKTKHAGLIQAKGLSDKALSGIAAMLAITVTQEDQIETVISGEGVVEALTGIQSEVDSRVGDALKKAKNETPKPGEETKKPETPPAPADMPDWAKTISEQLQSVTSELANFKNGQAATSRRGMLEAKLDKAPDAFKNAILAGFDVMSFKDDEAFTGYLSAIQPQIDAVKQTSKEENLTEQGKTIFGKKEDGTSNFTDMLSQMPGVVAADKAAATATV